MLNQTQTPSSPAPPAAAEISAASLLEELSRHPAKSLIFHYEGRDVLPGYHVTEVKSGAFQALDCGANFESWHETFIQLWNVPSDDGRTFMPVAKFHAIIRKVAATVPFDPDAKLTFEVSDGQHAMQIYRASSVEIFAATVRVYLTQRPASCKPRDRWLADQKTGTPTVKCCN